MRILSLVFAVMFLLSPMASARPEILVNIPQYMLILSDNGAVIKQYQVAVGTPYEQTPVGKFLVSYKEKNPTWYPGSGFVDKTPVPPGPDNPLGTRWIEFKPAYGVHGTNKAWSIEYPVSGGCIRMYNVDVEELYELVEIGTPIQIIYQTITVVEKADGLYLRVYPDIYDKKTTTREQFLLLIAPYQKRYPVIFEPKWPISVDTPTDFKLASKQAVKTP